jgi:rubrerythrin
MSRTMISRLFAVLIALVLPVAFASAQTSSRTTTISNLNTAIQGEANAAHRYDLFAKQADQEGYSQVARLFRAAALAESIHLKNHQEVLRSLGVEPTPPMLEQVQIGTTRQNLEIPIKGERNEQGEMYPAFVKQAREANMPAAAQSFTFALETEAEHAKLFEDALTNLGHNAPTHYYVGRISGDTVTRLPASPRETYTQVD